MRSLNSWNTVFVALHSLPLSPFYLSSPVTQFCRDRKVLHTSASVREDEQSHRSTCPLLPQLSRPAPIIPGKESWQKGFTQACREHKRDPCTFLFHELIAHAFRTPPASFKLARLVIAYLLKFSSSIPVTGKAPHNLLCCDLTEKTLLAQSLCSYKNKTLSLYKTMNYKTKELGLLARVISCPVLGSR